MTAPHEGRLVAGGWLAMISAVLTVPWMIITFSAVDKTSPFIRSVEAAMLVTGTIIFLYLMLTLRSLLVGKYLFSLADRPLVWLVQINVIAAILGFIGAIGSEPSDFMDGAGIILIAVTGVIQVVFGMRLLHLPDNLHGLRTPFCYVNIATGVSLALIFLLPLGMLTSAIGDVMLATVFFHAAAEMGQMEDEPWPDQ